MATPPFMLSGHLVYNQRSSGRHILAISVFRPTRHFRARRESSFRRSIAGMVTLWLIGLLAAPLAKAIAMMGAGQEMACCKRDGHSCCKRKAKADNRQTLKEGNACGERCARPAMGFTAKAAGIHSSTLPGALLESSSSLLATVASDISNVFLDEALHQRPPPTV